MNQSVPKDDMRKTSKKTAIELKIIQNGRFATLLFIIGSFLTLIQFDETEKVIFETTSNKSGKGYNANSEANAARTAEAASLIFLIAIFIYAANAITTYKMQLANLKSSASARPKLSDITAIQGWKLVAFFDLIKVIAFTGTAIGYHINVTAVQQK